MCRRYWASFMLFPDVLLGKREDAGAAECNVVLLGLLAVLWIYTEYNPMGGHD